MKTCCRGVKNRIKNQTVRIAFKWRSNYIQITFEGVQVAQKLCKDYAKKTWFFKVFLYSSSFFSKFNDVALKVCGNSGVVQVNFEDPHDEHVLEYFPS